MLLPCCISMLTLALSVIIYKAPLFWLTELSARKTVLSWNLELEFLYMKQWKFPVDLKEKCCVCCAFYDLYFNQAPPS